MSVFRCVYMNQQKYIQMIENAPSPNDEMKIKHGTTDYGYAQNEMKLYVDQNSKNSKCREESDNELRTM